MSQIRQNTVEMHHYSVNLFVFYFVIVWRQILGHPNNLAWYGGPYHWDCEHSAELFTHSGQYVKENVIAMKAVTFHDEIYVMTPRLKRGVLATVWRLVQGRNGVELQPFPSLKEHALANCTAIQNAVDIYLDYLGNIWVLDSGIIETIELARCTCPPKVVEISMLLGKVTRKIELTSLAHHSSILQSIVIEYTLGATKPYIYVSDASHGAVLVHELSTGGQWTLVVSTPAPRLQLALVRRSPTHAMLLIIRAPYVGILELDTSTLRRRNSLSPIRVCGEQEKPVVLLGTESHYVYLRHSEYSDVLQWDVREAFNASRLLNLHTPGPRLTAASVTAEPLKHTLLILDSSYIDSIRGKGPTFHRITIIGQH